LQLNFLEKLQQDELDAVLTDKDQELMAQFLDYMTKENYNDNLL